MVSAKEILKKVWGYDSFREMQEDIVGAVLEGKDVLALLPTGGGKSICFQVPALMLEGICIVVTPLIALMKDQVSQLQRKGVKAVAIYSGMSYKEIDVILDNCVYGDTKFLYVSPERLKTDILIERALKMNVSLIAVDEAHCISQWGYDFRPPYLEIATFRDLMPQANIIALTASATKTVQDDIVNKLEFDNPTLFQKSFARANLSYSVRKEEDKTRKLLEILGKVAGSAIVYVRTRKETKEVAKLLYGKGLNADFYHGGLRNDERSAKQEKWTKNKLRVMVATNAFGMGIDKPDVRVVVHMDFPDSMEAYYQEAGRAGRDGKKAFAVLLYNDWDVENLKARIEKSHPSVEYMKKVYQCLSNYFQLAVGSGKGDSKDFVLLDFTETYNLNYSEVYYAIKKIQEEGFLQLNETYNNPSKVFIKVDNKQLYEFQIAHAKFDIFIKGLLRVYGGELFTNFVTVSEYNIANFLALHVQQVIQNLQTLANYGIIIYDQQKEKPQLTFLTHRFDASNVPFDHKRLQQRKQSDIDKAKAVTDYAQHQNRCRTQLILEYFGEVSYDKCGVCDICVNEKGKRHHSDLDQYYHQVMAVLEQGKFSIEDLVGRINPKDKEELLEVIREMVDSGAIKYDPNWSLEIG